jgi:two-component sensor histidine kinase
MVQALAGETLKGVAERTAVDALLDRIVAMGAAHDVLFRKGWTTATVGEVARATLAATIERIDIKGPEVPLGARVTVTLSLLLHELATNAAKYGALSMVNGRVILSWKVDEPANLLTIRWRETGGPATRPPDRTGSGSRLIEMGLSQHGTVARRYLDTGFEAEIKTPMPDLLAE